MLPRSRSFVQVYDPERFGRRLQPSAAAAPDLPPAVSRQLSRADRLQLARQQQPARRHRPLSADQIHSYTGSDWASGGGGGGGRDHSPDRLAAPVWSTARSRSQPSLTQKQRPASGPVRVSRAGRAATRGAAPKAHARNLPTAADAARVKARQEADGHLREMRSQRTARLQRPAPQPRLAHSRPRPQQAPLQSQHKLHRLELELQQLQQQLQHRPARVGRHDPEEVADESFATADRRAHTDDDWDHHHRHQHHAHQEALLSQNGTETDWYGKNGASGGGGGGGGGGIFDAALDRHEAAGCGDRTVPPERRPPANRPFTPDADHGRSADRLEVLQSLGDLHEQLQVTIR